MTIWSKSTQGLGQGLPVPTHRVEDSFPLKSAMWVWRAIPSMGIESIKSVSSVLGYLQITPTGLSMRICQ